MSGVCFICHLEWKYCRKTELKFPLPIKLSDCILGLLSEFRKEQCDLLAVTTDSIDRSQFPCITREPSTRFSKEQIQPH